MTREEAIALFEKQLTAAQVVLDSGFGSNPGENNFLYRRRKEMAEIALTALRPVSREQVEKVWRGCSWCNNEGKKPENWECSLLDDCGFSVVVGDEVVWTNAEFCPVCGKPLTDEAAQMVMERLEALKDGKGD